jgi:hypothetical protein
VLLALARGDNPMPTKTTPLQAVAAKDDDAKDKRKKLGLLASIASALGLGDSKTVARMSKRTEVTKHTITEEDDGDDAEEEAEDDDSEEEEAEDSATDMSNSEAEEEESDEGSEAEEEEEEEEERAEYDEEEEEKAAARAIAKAYKSPAVRDAFLAAVPKKFRASAALRAPDRVVREMKRATNARTIDDAMTALSRSRKSAAKGDAKVIKATAQLAARVQKVESENRKQRVDAMVNDAKAAGKAPTKALRAQLREHGNAHGTKALASLISSLPVVARTNASQPKIDGHGNPLGAPNADAQALEKSMFGHLPEKERAEAIKEYRALYEKKYGANAAGGDA